jgi:hypothetical protein
MGVLNSLNDSKSMLKASKASTGQINQPTFMNELFTLSSWHASVVRARQPLINKK